MYTMYTIVVGPGDLRYIGFSLTNSQLFTNTSMSQTFDQNNQDIIIIVTRVYNIIDNFTGYLLCRLCL